MLLIEEIVDTRGFKSLGQQVESFIVPKANRDSIFSDLGVVFNWWQVSW